MENEFVNVNISEEESIDNVETLVEDAETFNSDEVTIDKIQDFEVDSEISEKVTLDDNEVENITEFDDSKLEDLLRSYFKSESVGVESSGVESSGVEFSGVESSGVESSGIEFSGSEYSNIDYTALLEDLLSDTGNLNDSFDSLNTYIEDYENNNNLQSNVDDISLSNLLLILCFIGFLVSALFDFARRVI